MRNRKAGWLIVLIMILLVLLLSACNDKQKGRYDSSVKVKVDNVPTDVCVVDGKPLILAANSESDGGFTLVYVRENGDIVAKNWVPAPITQELKAGGEFFWTGGVCPADQ